MIRNYMKNQDIQKLVEKYEVDRNMYLTDRYNETQVRSDFLDPLFELLGWDIKNKAGRPTNEREVILEEPLKANADEVRLKQWSVDKQFLKQTNELKLAA